MILTSRTADAYPQVRQYLHTEFKEASNNNNIWGFGTPAVDSLIQVYEDDLDSERRRDAMYRIDEIVREEAFYIPFWAAPYLRVVYWDYIRFPDFYLPRRTEQHLDWLVYWIDPDRRARLEQAMARGEALPLDEEVDKDYYGVRGRPGS
jgi:microcin C transport system substrate-binding protein